VILQTVRTTEAVSDKHQMALVFLCGARNFCARTVRVVAEQANGYILQVIWVAWEYLWVEYFVYLHRRNIVIHYVWSGESRSCSSICYSEKRSVIFMMSHHAHRTSHKKTDLLRLNSHAKTLRREGIFAQNIEAWIIYIYIFFISTLVFIFDSFLNINFVSRFLHWLWTCYDNYTMACGAG